MIRERLKNFPVVSVLGPREVGKTTLAQPIPKEQAEVLADRKPLKSRVIGRPQLFPSLIGKLGSHSAGRGDRDENARGWYGGGGKFKDTTVRSFRSS